MGILHGRLIDPCLPTKVAKPPDWPDWAHEIKHDGYRLQIHVGGGDVRLYTISGYDWTDRYPGIVAAAAKLKSAMVIDAGAVIQGADGVTDFEALHGRIHNAEAFAYVFDLLLLDGQDLRGLPWRERWAELERIFRRSRSGLVLSKSVIGRGPDVRPPRVRRAWKPSCRSESMRPTGREDRRVG